jgi:alkylation response protein AidB-like acyl-CoA dehydrogenase
VIVTQTLVEISPGIAVGVMAHAGLGLYALYRFGNEEQKKRYFLPGVKGEKISAFANTEPTAGSDVANIELQVRPVSGGGGTCLTEPRFSLPTELSRISS